MIAYLNRQYAIHQQSLLKVLRSDQMRTSRDFFDAIVGKVVVISKIPIPVSSRNGSIQTEMLREFEAEMRRLQGVLLVEELLNRF